MGGVAHSHHFDIVCTILLLGDCRVGTGQRTTSIIAGIIKCQQNYNRGFHDHFLNAII